MLALADSLVASGAFSVTEWSEALGRELKAAQSSGAPDTPDTYYQSAQRALEDLLAERSQVSNEELNDRRKAWQRAYENTPHGQPVELMPSFASESEKTHS